MQTKNVQIQIKITNTYKNVQRNFDSKGNVLSLPGSSVPVFAVQVIALSLFQRVGSELLATSCRSFEHSQPEKE